MIAAQNPLAQAEHLRRQISDDGSDRRHHTMREPAGEAAPQRQALAQPRDLIPQPADAAGIAVGPARLLDGGLRPHGIRSGALHRVLSLFTA
ncbi:UNVERIFIED_ORG: hypothetical protein M2438_005099 [Methylobacterium sp. SuP10 SLI 274]|nr:hypothetical protein [Methylobacterium sp. SuP10 SLI 274]